LKPVTSYQSVDGSIFDTAEECAKYETHCSAIAKIIDRLPRFVSTDDFQTGKSYYQHDIKSFKEIRDIFFMYMDSLYDLSIFQSQIGESILITNTNWYIKFFRATNDKPALLAWYYIGMVDSRYRQWSTPYFVTNPNEEAYAINANSDII